MRDWLIKIRRHDHSSLQTQIRESLVAAILDGQLERDEPVPSTRRMAKVLGVSRNTVVIAYQALLDDVQRFFEAHPARALQRNIRQSLETIDRCIQTRNQQGQNLAAFLTR